MVVAFREDSTSKGTLLRRSSLSGTPTVTLCSVHIHNVVAKKRDASTELLQRLHGYTKQYNVDFIGGDFNMSAFSTVGDVFSDPEFSAPGNSFLWGRGAFEEQCRECTGFLIMPKRPYEWRVVSQGKWRWRWVGENGEGGGEGRGERGREGECVQKGVFKEGVFFGRRGEGVTGGHGRSWPNRIWPELVFLSFAAFGQTTFSQN